MADSGSDRYQNDGVEVATNPDMINFTDGIEATESEGTLRVGLKDDGVSIEHLDAGILPAYVCVGGVLHTWDAGAATSDTAEITGVLATDLILANFTTTNTNGVMIEQVARTSANTVTITTSGNAANGDVIAIAAFRAAS